MADCCRPYLDGSAAAPTAEALMRSRFTAYATGDIPYLLESWHESTRPAALDLEPGLHWIRLKILDSGEDRVEFIATCRINGKAHKMHERSRFVREDGRWYYLDGE